MSALFATIVLAGSALCGPADAAPSAAAPVAPGKPASSRLVHRFDFDERGQGNLEDLPRYWTPVRGGPFSRLGRGGFDDGVGRLAWPSFRIESLGRDVAFQYDGREIPVRAGNRYRIEGFLRTKDVKHSRVCVSAHFLDDQKHPIASSTVRTNYLTGEHAGEWTSFELNLAAAPVEAKNIGLVAWILQDSTWNQNPVAFHISAVDVAATAWLDDLNVYRLPEISITTKMPGEMIRMRGEASLWVEVIDSDRQAANARLTVVSAGGTPVIEQHVESGADSAGACRIDVSALPPGPYQARVEILSESSVAYARTLDFLKLPESAAEARRTQSFGIVVEARSRPDSHTESALLKALPSRCVKMPLEQARRAAVQGTDSVRQSQQFFQELTRDQFLITAVLEAPASAETQSWEGSIAGLATPYASLIRWWQVGEDRHSPLTHDVSMAQLTKVQSVLGKFINDPRMAACMSTSEELMNVPVAKQVTLSVTSQSDLWNLRPTIENLKIRGCEVVCAYVPPLSPARYQREARLAEWAKRIVLARHRGADVVFVPQPWSGPLHSGDQTAHPHEEYILFHTIAGLLGDSRPGPQVRVAGNLTCLTFRGTSTSVLAIWDEAPAAEPRTVAIQLGAATRQIDAWGGVRPLTRDAASRHLIHVSSSPVFIDGVENLVVDVAAAVRMEPNIVESGTDVIQQQLIFDCTTKGFPSARGVLHAPRGIDVSPKTFSLSACSGQQISIPFEVRYGHNEPAGEKNFVVELTAADPAYSFYIPVPVDIRMSAVEVAGRALLSKGDLILRHTLVNHSTQPLSFRSIAAVPGRPRQYRPVTNLDPGQTQIVEYRFDDAQQLAGRTVNLTLRELNDGPRRHNLEIAVP